MKQSITLSLLFITSCLLLTGCQTFVAREASVSDVKVLKHPFLQEIVVEKAKKTNVVQGMNCPAAQVKPLDDFIIFAPLKFDSSNQLVKGTWRQRASWKGCGKERLINILLDINANQEKIRAVNITPGNTRADPRLQIDAGMSAILLAVGNAKNRSCKNRYIDDTKFLGMTGAEPSWDELWTTDVCGEKIQEIVHFTTDMTGTGFHVELKKK